MKLPLATMHTTASTSKYMRLALPKELPRATAPRLPMRPRVRSRTPRQHRRTLRPLPPTPVSRMARRRRLLSRQDSHRAPQLRRTGHQLTLPQPPRMPPPVRMVRRQEPQRRTVRHRALTLHQRPLMALLRLTQPQGLRQHQVRTPHRRALTAHQR